ncbi:hypothetical protein AMTR_s00092p00113280 [Amborella trichopoda]|uniref:Uncharacterized protein n=1 Tax=Amborella trichopoda TaxID=13333 RepID=W1NVF3_AMBTC|nr:hypothetical protein AMTR_s00092p00113280 [Amborella trichopoda]
MAFDSREAISQTETRGASKQAVSELKLKIHLRQKLLKSLSKLSKKPLENLQCKELLIHYHPLLSHHSGKILPLKLHFTSAVVQKEKKKPELAEFFEGETAISYKPKSLFYTKFAVLYGRHECLAVFSEENKNPKFPSIKWPLTHDFPPSLALRNTKRNPLPLTRDFPPSLALRNTKRNLYKSSLSRRRREKSESFPGFS